MSTIIAEIAKGFRLDFPGDALVLEKLAYNLLGIICTPGITNTIAVDEGINGF
jgi:hypothetical protein